MVKDHLKIYLRSYTVLEKKFIAGALTVTFCVAFCLFASGCSESDDVAATRELAKAVSDARIVLLQAQKLITNPVYEDLYLTSVDSSSVEVSDETLAKLDHSVVDPQVRIILVNAESQLGKKITDLESKADGEIVAIANMVRASINETLADCMLLEVDAQRTELLGELTMGKGLLNKIDLAAKDIKHYESLKNAIGSTSGRSEDHDGKKGNGESESSHKT